MQHTPSLRVIVITFVIDSRDCVDATYFSSLLAYLVGKPTNNRWPRGHTLAGSMS